MDGLGDTGEDIGNRVGRALDALKLLRRSVARWKICCRLDSGENCGVETDGRRKGGSLVESCALDASVEYIKRGLEFASPLRPIARDILPSQHMSCCQAGVRGLVDFHMPHQRATVNIFVLVSSTRSDKCAE